eukprot:765190-Pleurochrysis_carterae.AAC.1
MEMRSIKFMTCAPTASGAAQPSQVAEEKRGDEQRAPRRASQRRATARACSGKSQGQTPRERNSQSKLENQSLRVSARGACEAPYSVKKSAKHCKAQRPGRESDTRRGQRSSLAAGECTCAQHVLTVGDD